MDQPSTSPRQERARGFSFRSDKSSGSGGNKITESPQDKARRDSIWKNQSKANPNAALSEAQPAILNVTEESTLQSLRTAQHKDANGNPIVDPDLSNPTRPRLERPLDTIRSFERAIDAGYKRRSSYARTDSYENQNQNNYQSKRSSSYFGGYDSGPSPTRHSQHGGGYYGQQRDGYSNGPGGRMRYSNNRMHSDPALYGSRPYPNPNHGYHQSQDTMNTGVTNGSDSTGPWANSTDPSSENSSIDRNIVGANGNGYHHNGHNAPIQEEGAYGYGGPVQAPRKPIPLGNSGDAPPRPAALPSTARAEPEKKKGWLKKRFSKA